MTLRKPGTSIPPSNSYPGLLAYSLGEGREIVCLGSGEEAERVLLEAVKKKEAE